MNHNFTNDDFEDFLKNSADNLRMPPSEKVWTNISKDLKKRRRRIGYFSSAFLLLSGCFGYLLFNSSKDIASTEVAISSTNTTEAANNAKVSVEQSTFFTAPNVATKPAKQAKVISINSLKKNTPPINSHKNTGLIKTLLAKTVLKDQAETQIEKSVEVDSTEAFESTIIDSDITGDITLSDPNIIEDVSDNEISIENVTNLYKGVQNKVKKIGFQFSFTPTVSYRKLSENKSYLRNAASSSLTSSNPALLYDVNNAVTHKPDIGLEVGMLAKYPIAKSINLRSGLQFNISRYDIKAFRAPTEIATIALTTSANQVDIVGASTNYRNFNGYKSDWLQNFYFQISAPVGLEFKMYGNRKTHFGIASTVQPTYILGEKAYLLSTDYKNYTEVPWLSRRWNVNTALETYVSYSSGKIQWQVGPQVRYQLLSSFASEYPLKENLFDFGLRVGISLNKLTEENKSK